MKINKREVDTVTVIELADELDTTTAPEVEAYLQDLNGNILINLEALEYTSSAGLRVLLATAKRLQVSGGVLRVCCLNSIIEEIFDVSGFTTILNVHKDETEALAAF